MSSGDTYTYDANGNMTQRVESGVTTTQTFDAENRMASGASGGFTGQMVYDGDGNMVKKINPDGSLTLYVSGVYEVNKSSGGAVTSTKTYYPAGGAMRDSSTLYYILKDHLGSTGILSNSGGAVVADQRYYPFGETRVVTGSMYTDRLFTGQREMTGSGIYYYGARYYSPKLGRFLSADTIVPGYGNPQNLNRYSYVLNDPVKLTDPTGHKACGDGEYTNCDTGHKQDPNQNPHPPQPTTSSNDGDGDEDNDGNTCTGMECLYGHPPSVPTVTLPIPTTGQTCDECALEGAEGILHFLEGLVLASSVIALVVLGLPESLFAVPFLLLPFAAGVNWAMVGIQEMIKGTTNNANMKIDYLPLVHLIFPDALRFK